jgi:circadian clock protein KaiC
MKTSGKELAVAHRSRGREVARASATRSLPRVAKVPSGVKGLDEITGGGLPKGRPTLVCGGPGCGKTLFAMEFLVRGAIEHGEPGVFVSFEESREELAANVGSLGFDVQRLETQKKLAIDHVRVERAEIEETGEYNLEGLFVRLQHAVDSVGARRVALDTIESLFSALANETILRSELRRLFRWLKERQLTTIITAERGAASLTRQGLEEYVSDCVILLDHRVTEQVSTRRLRVVKYRGSVHGTNEYPFLIDESGISVMPITSLSLQHRAPVARVSTGIPRLDEMLDGKGYFEGSTVLVSGTAGTGKTSVAAHLALATCSRGERCLYFAFEESAAQILRNMRSIGLDLEPSVRNGRLRIEPFRPHSSGLEQHLTGIHKAVTEFEPRVVIMDPISNLVGVGTASEARSMLTRVIDHLKSRGITTLFTNLTTGTVELEETDVGISSLIDTWLMLEVVRSGGERNRIMNIVKSRGMAHSNQTCEFRLTREGVQIVDTYLGASEVLTGSARLAREAADEAAATLRSYGITQKQALRETRRKAFENELAALRARFAADDCQLEREIREEEMLQGTTASDRTAMGRSRKAFAGATATKNAHGNGGGR